MNPTIVDNTLNGKCSNCGECCAEYIPWTQAEVDTVKQYLIQHPEVKQQDHQTPEGLHILCAFRDRVNKKCLIYPVRPKVCKQFICNQAESTMEYNKMLNHLKADYNAMDSQGKLTHFASSDYLFFNDLEYDTQYVYNITGNKDKTIKILHDLNACVIGEE